MKNRKSEFLLLACAALITAAVWSVVAAASDRAQVGTATPQWIYYDYLENGVLKGGRVPVDFGNPLHTLVSGSRGSPYSPGAPWVPLIENGPNQNRIDLVLVGDGYTAAELPAYAQHAGAILPVVFGEFPFSAYATFFNAYRVDVASNESGVDHDPSFGVYKDTAMDMGFWCGNIERLLCVNVGKAISFADCAPGRDLVLAMANSSKYGGAGYSGSDLATVAAANGSSIEVALHEFGHALPDLADEYDYADGTQYNGGEVTEANVSIYTASQMDAQNRKWHLWLPDGNVDTFEGARYYQYGIYRPTSNSKMRSLNRPFEQVNNEQFIVSFYKIVRPLDDASGDGTYYGDTTLFVDPVHPSDHDLDVQWRADGSVVATGVDSIDLQSLGLSLAKHAIDVTVMDQTDQVRDESLRAQWMTENRAWTWYPSEIGLDVNPDNPKAGDQLSCVTTGGKHLGAVILAVVRVNGAAVFTQIATGLFIGDFWGFAATVPPGLAGTTIDLRSFGVAASTGRGEASNPETVTFQ